MVAPETAATFPRELATSTPEDGSAEPGNSTMPHAEQFPNFTGNDSRLSSDGAHAGHASIACPDIPRQSRPAVTAHTRRPRHVPGSGRTDSGDRKRPGGRATRPIRRTARCGAISHHAKCSSNVRDARFRTRRVHDRTSGAALPPDSGGHRRGAPPRRATDVHSKSWARMILVSDEHPWIAQQPGPPRHAALPCSAAAPPDP